MKIVLVEPRILQLKDIRDLDKDLKPESKIRWERLKSSTWNSESTAWNPESKTALDSHGASPKLPYLPWVTPFYKPYLYVSSQSVGFLRRFGLKKGENDFGLEWGMVFVGTTEVYERIHRSFQIQMR